MIFKLILLLCLATATVNACDYDLIEDIYDYYDNDNDSPEKPGQNESSSTKPPEIGPRPSTNPAPDSASNNNSSNKDTSGRSFETQRHHGFKHHRRHVIRRIPLKSTGDIDEEPNESRGLYDRYQHPSRYAPNYQHPSAMINSDKSEDDNVKIGRRYVMIPAEKLKSADKSRENQHDSSTRLVQGIHRKLYWFDMQNEDDESDYVELDRVRKSAHVLEFPPRRRIEIPDNRDQVFMETQRRRIEIPESRDQVLMRMEGNRLVLINPSRMEGEKEKEDVRKYVILKSVEKEDKIREEIDESDELRKISMERISVGEIEDREPERESTVRIVLMNPMQINEEMNKNKDDDSSEEEDEEEEEQEDSKMEGQKIVNLILGRNQQTYMINYRPSNEGIVVKNDQSEILKNLKEARIPIYLENREKEKPIAPITININNEYGPNKILAESKDPDMNKIDHIKEHTIRKYIKHYPDDNSEAQTIYEKIHSSYVKNPPDIPKPESNQSEYKPEDHSMDNNMMVQRLPDINSQDDFHQHPVNNMEYSSIQHLPLAETSFEYNENPYPMLKPIDSKDSEYVENSKQPINIHQVTTPRTVTYNRNPEAVRPEQHNQMQYRPTEMYHHYHQQPMHNDQHHKLPLVDMINRFNEESVDSSEGDNKKEKVDEMKVENSTASSMKHKIKNIV